MKKTRNGRQTTYVDLVKAAMSRTATVMEIASDLETLLRLKKLADGLKNKRARELS